jgi:MFS family permease
MSVDPERAPTPADQLHAKRWLVLILATEQVPQLAPKSFAVLIGARALQGVFGALLAPSALSLLTLSFQYSHDRQRAFGMLTAIAGSVA